ncbi:MAG: sporulation initiation factor Spo0A C-terminal domain-containing protein [Saccharofermentanales bacterium]
MHQIESQLPEAIDRVLDGKRYPPRAERPGYCNIFFIRAALDERKLKPLSKTLYPEVAKHFKARTSQIERDIRYAFSSAGKRGSWPSESE